MKQFCLAFLLLAIGPYSWAQNQQYTAPLNIPLVLSGTFGELRSNHFHAGIDIKTQGRTGLDVLAIADGYVSRIKVSTGGYGKAIYITHPKTGHTSVYGHLKSFSPDIEAYVKAMQYAREEFEIELFPDSKRLPVLKGERIAYSGNTGGSFGPHLHFEVRDTKTEMPMNPLIFGFKVKDTRAPEIKEVVFYALDGEGNVLETLGSYSPISGKSPPTLRLRNPGSHIGFGIEVYDRQDLANNQNGNYLVEVKVNGESHYRYAMDGIFFNESRYINALLDYPQKSCCGKKVQRLYKLPNNELKFLRNQSMGGVPTDSTQTLDLEFIAKDFSKNTSSLSLKVQIIPRKGDQETPNGQLFEWNSINNYISDSVQVFTPAGAFYQNFHFQSSTEQGDWLSPVYNVHNTSVPVHKAYRLLIRPHDTAKKFKDKTYIVSLNDRGRDIYEGGDWDGPFMAVGTRSFGKYTVRLDTVPPLVDFPYLRENAQYTGTRISVRVQDHGSGIKDYRVELDGKFILFEYEPKKSLLFYEVDERLTNGKHQLKVYLSDRVGNSSEMIRTFEYVSP